jgi:exosome complex component RRP40
MRVCSHVSATQFVMATRAGLLREKNDRYWVDSMQKRYVPNEGDLVLGIITGRGVEAYDVDLGSAFEGTLPYDQFEKATKKNRPPWEVGDLVYCRVTLANRDMDPELSCVNSRGKAGEFGGEGFVDGLLVRCSIRLARALMYKSNTCLRALGQSLPFEVAVGMNGRLFVKSPSPATTMLVVAALQNSEHLNEADTVAMVAALVARNAKK